MDQLILSTNIAKKVEKLLRELEVVKKEIKKAIKIPKSQAWFWSKEWQRKEWEADKAIKDGKVKSLSSVEELLKDLRE